MGTGYKGTFVIAWAQSEVDGLVNAPLTTLTTGATWRWTGQAVCVDGARDVFVLGDAIGQAELHQRAAASVRKLLGDAVATQSVYSDPESRARLFDGGFDLTDGVTRYEVTLIDDPALGSPLLMFLGDMPKPYTDLWVVAAHIASVRENATRVDHNTGAVICFTPGTKIQTPDGPRLVEELREGDMVDTKDNGPQALRWIGGRRISGARLYAMPHLRPVRIRANALGMGEPDEDLLVSPQHRMLVSGAPARELFNADEVLVAAKDLVNDTSILIDRRQQELTYIHLLFDRHQVIMANGMDTESFHPGHAGLDEIAPEHRSRLIERFPSLEDQADIYGPEARRTLTSAEAAILLHAVA